MGDNIPLSAQKVAYKWLEIIKRKQLEVAEDELREKEKMMETYTIDSRVPADFTSPSAVIRTVNYYGNVKEKLSSTNPEQYTHVSSGTQQHISFEFVMSPLSLSDSESNDVINAAKSYSDTTGNYLHNILNSRITITPRDGKQLQPLLQIMAQQDFYNGISSDYGIEHILFDSKYLAYAIIYDHDLKMRMVIGQVTGSDSYFTDELSKHVIECFGIDVIAKAVFPGTISNPLGGITALLLFQLMLLGYIQIKGHPVMMILESVLTGFTYPYEQLRQDHTDYMKLKANFVKELIYGPRQSYMKGDPDYIITITPDILKLGSKAILRPIKPFAPGLSLEDESNYEFLGPLVSCPYNTYLNIPLNGGGLRLNYVKIISKLYNLDQFVGDPQDGFLFLQDEISKYLDIIDNTISTAEEKYEALYKFEEYITILFDVIFTEDARHPTTQPVIFNTVFKSLIDLGTMVDEKSVVHAINTYGGVISKKLEVPRRGKEKRREAALQPYKDDIVNIKTIIDEIAKKRKVLQALQAFNRRYKGEPMSVGFTELIKKVKHEENKANANERKSIPKHTGEDDNDVISLPVIDGIIIDDNRHSIFFSSSIETAVETHEGKTATGGRTTRHKMHRKTKRRINKKRKSKRR